MISTPARVSVTWLFACVALAFLPPPALAAVGASPSLQAALGQALDAVQPAQARRASPAARQSTKRGRIRRPRGSGNPVYSNIRPNATLPLSIMVPEPGVRQPPPPAAQIVPARPLPPVVPGQRATIVPPAVTPNPETFNDRVVRCTHSAGVNGISPGQQGAYVSNCAM